MQTSNRFFDDLAKVASGAASTLVGVKQEIEAFARQQVERFVGEFDLVRRDEFEAVQALAANARAEQERLEQRVAALEEQLSGDCDRAIGTDLRRGLSLRLPASRICQGRFAAALPAALSGDVACARGAVLAL